MKIFLMRHGEAGFDAPNDDQRSLTERGRLHVQKNIETRKPDLLSVQHFFSSPIRRARQTADLAHALLRPASSIEEVDWLIHETPPARAIASLALCPFDSVLLFSHQPLASRFVERLCGLRPGDVRIDTAGLLAIDADPAVEGSGCILWQLH